MKTTTIWTHAKDTKTEHALWTLCIGSTTGQCLTTMKKPGMTKGGWNSETESSSAPDCVYYVRIIYSRELHTPSIYYYFLSSNKMLSCYPDFNVKRRVHCYYMKFKFDQVRIKSTKWQSDITLQSVKLFLNQIHSQHYTGKQNLQCV